MSADKDRVLDICLLRWEAGDELVIVVGLAHQDEVEWYLTQIDRG